MQRQRALAGIWGSVRCCRQRTRCLSTKSPFASFISDVKIPESLAASESVEQTRWNAPRLSSLGDIEIPSSIPSKSTTSLFAARAAERQKRLQAEATVKATEVSVTNTQEPPPAPSRSLLSRKSQRLRPKDEERRSGGGQLKPQTDANVRSRRPSNVVTSPQVDSRADRRRGESRVARPRAIMKKTLPDEDLEFEIATPPVLHVGFNETDLSELFSSSVPTPYIARPSVAQSHIDTRLQLLKERAGDYSRYLPGEIDPTALTVGSVGYARLVLSRRKDVGLKSRHTSVVLMQEAGVNVDSTSASATSS